MKTIKYRILYEKGTIRRLAERFGVSEQTVRSALRFATEGELPDLIRSTAIKEYGGVLTRKPIIISGKEA